jgi:RNA polymerase sigma-32 factor
VQKPVAAPVEPGVEPAREGPVRRRPARKGAKGATVRKKPDAESGAVAPSALDAREAAEPSEPDEPQSLGEVEGVPLSAGPGGAAVEVEVDPAQEGPVRRRPARKGAKGATVRKKSDAESGAAGPSALDASEAAEPSEPDEPQDLGEVDGAPLAEPGDAAAEVEVEVEEPVKALAPRSQRDLAPQNALQRYMRDVERHPLLSREEEHDLAVRYVATGNLDAAYRLVTANLRLVVKIAHEYHRTAFSLLDLVQEGNVGLMHAVKKFDPYRGVKLSSYSAWWIRAYILRYIMENWRIVKLGTTQAQRKLFFNLRKMQERLASQGFDPTPKLLAERLNVSERDVTEMDQRLGQDEFSLDAPIAEDSRSTRSDRLTAREVPADERLADHEIKQILREKLALFGKDLKDKERYIFEKRLVAEEPVTLQVIGNHYGITRERARQIEAKLIRDLKTWIQREVPDFKHLEIGPRDD